MMRALMIHNHTHMQSLVMKLHCLYGVTSKYSGEGEEEVVNKTNTIKIMSLGKQMCLQLDVDSLQGESGRYIYIYFFWGGGGCFRK